MVVKSYTLATVVNYFFNYFCRLHFLDFHRQAITHHVAVVNATWYSTWKAQIKTNTVVKCKPSRRLDRIIAALLAACQPEVSHSLFVSACIMRLPPHDPRYQDLDTVGRGHAPVAPATLSTNRWSRQLSQAYLVSFASYLTLNNIVTLKTGLEVSQGHWNWCHSKAWVRFPIRLP